MHHRTLAAVAAGLGLVALGSWRTGVTWMGAGLLGAALARAVLGDHSAGMLRVRRARWVDVVLMAAAGTVMVVLALTIPDQLP